MTDETETNWAINLGTIYCPECKEPMPKLRVPENLHQIMWGGWMCPECGCRMDKAGKPLARPHGAEEPT